MNSQQDPNKLSEAERLDLVGGVTVLIAGALIFGNLIVTDPDFKPKTWADIKNDFVALHQKVSAGPTGKIEVTHWTDVFKYYGRFQM